MATYPLGALAVTRRSARLFSWEASDLSLVARTGQIGTYARNDTQSAGVVDTNGVYGPSLPNQPRYVSVDSTADGVRDAVAVLLEAGATNLALESDALATSPWTATTLSVTNAFAAFDGLSWSRVSSATAGSLAQSIGTLAGGNGVYALSVHVRQDAGVTGTFSISIQETAGTVRGRVTVTISAGGVVTAVATTGGVIVDPPSTRGGYRVHCISTACTAANAHTIFVSNFSGAGGTATSYLLAGVQFEFGAFASSYIRTTASTASRLADTLTFPVLAPPQASTLYIKFLERGTILTGATNGLLGIGASVPGTFYVFNAAGGLYNVEYNNGSASTSGLATAPAYGHLCELRATLTVDPVSQLVTAQLFQSIAGGAETSGAPSTAQPLASAWHDTTLTLNDRGGVPGYSAIQSVRWAAGVQPLSAMRATA